MNQALRKTISAGEEDSLNTVCPSHLHLYGLVDTIVSQWIHLSLPAIITLNLCLYSMVWGGGIFYLKKKRKRRNVFFYLVAASVVFKYTFYCNNYAALWAVFIWTRSFSNRKEITYWSWSGKLKPWTKSLIFSHCYNHFFLFLHYYLFPALPTPTRDNPTDLISRYIFRCIVSS